MSYIQSDFTIETLGSCSINSPARSVRDGFIPEGTRIRLDVEVSPDEQPGEGLFLEKAGPREKIFFEPSQTTAAIVTCGGLSPGLNNVIRSIFYSLHYNYRVPRVLGVLNGYMGMTPGAGLEPIELTHDAVEDIDKIGGTILGSSRGHQDPCVMVDFLISHGINLIFCVGGDGTQRGAEALAREVSARGKAISVVGVPKTIDNDIHFVWQSFGYATALERASDVIKGAHVEARCAMNGIGLVKLMGRDAGFIASGATLASQEVNFVLVPEVDFPLEGTGGFLDALERRIQHNKHAVIVVAEGAGQHLFKATSDACDASGNIKYEDIGPFLKRRIIDYFERKGTPVTLKYLDPSYYIRSVPANTPDRILADLMGRHAVHAAMAGKTGLLIGYMHNQFVHVPICTAVREKKRLDVHGDTWESVLGVTRQPDW